MKEGNMRARLGSLSGFAVLIAGCTVGPDYELPDYSVPDAWRTAVVAELEDEDQPLEMWWTELQDTVLTDLIRRAELANLNLQAAVARVAEARARRGIAKGGYYPDIFLGGAYSYQKVSDKGVEGAVGGDGDGEAGGDGDGSPLSDPFSSWVFGLDLRWELDLFGRVRRTVESATASMQASVEDYRDVLVTLYAEVASAYVDIRTFQQRLSFARQNAQAQEESLELTRDRYLAGLTSVLDVAQAEQNLATTRSLIPTLETGLEASLNRLAVLLAQTPGSLHEELGIVRPIPEPTEAVAVGIPADLLRRRPDIRRAERELAAQTARIGAATAELYPSFSIGGSVGLEALDFTDLGSAGTGFFSIFPSFDWPIFTAGKIRNQIRVEEARTEQALVAYELTVLEALQEVQDAIVAYAQETIRRGRLLEAVNASQRAVELVRTQYLSGLTNFQNVLDTQRSLFEQQDLLADSEGLVVQNLILLNRSLGGGWQVGGDPTLEARATGQGEDVGG
ncbi:MAG: efflux transporter outer membrane subunit [Gemmatimonadota bacterium]|nr:MAG: efflux transporter outer membrane subunit [Gemmatimonadota bacterium]